MLSIFAKLFSPENTNEYENIQFPLRINIHHYI